MTAHFKVEGIGFADQEACAVVAWAWRGCCLELFSRAEHSVVECLDALKLAGLEIHKDGRSPFPMPRLKALRVCLLTYSFGGHERLACKLINDWEQLCDERNWLAHALIEPSIEGIVAQHISFEGKQKRDWPEKHLSREEMRKLLLRIKTNQTQLSRQLSHIKSAAPTAKPLTP